MSQWIKLTLAVAAVAIVLVESRVIPAEPVMMDAYGNPVVFLREKRTPVRPYPQQAMMFTSYYRPVRRSGNQATGVFAQGNAVSGQAFFDMQSPLMKKGPEPIEEPEVSSAEAQAFPAAEETLRDNEEEAQVPEGYQPQEDHHDSHHYDDQHHQHEYHGSGHPQQEDQHHQHHHEDEHHQHHHEDEHHQHHHEDEHHQHHHDQHHQNAQPPQEDEPEPVPVFTTEAAAPMPAEEPAPSNTEATVSVTKKVKKTRKPPVIVEEEDEDDEDEYDEPMMPSVPMKGNRRRQGYPSLNNFFPMVFTFPGAASRAGSGSASGSGPPGSITAIANSYSTGKGGLAHSVATAYGGPPPSKKRRMPQSEE